MTTKQVLIDEATEAELREFGRDTLGINMPPNAKLETLRAKVKAAWNMPKIRINDPDASDKPSQEGDEPVPVTAEQEPPPPKKVRIHIAVTEDPGGDEPVPVGVNGKVMLIPRGEDVEVPEPYFLVLQEAITFKYVMKDDNELDPVPRKVPLYPVTLVRAAA